MSSNTEIQTKRQTTVSECCDDGTIIETIMQSEPSQTAFAVWRSGACSIQDACTIADVLYRPIAAQNNLIRHHAVLLPDAPDAYGSSDALLDEIDAYIYRYVDLSDDFRRIAGAYVLLSWVYDAFNELPYLRFRGDYGSGKSRALLVVGSIAYKPFFASGASSVSPIFHTLDTFRGTLVFDETDFRFSDEKSELIKIFNNGNVRGFPVLRTAITREREFDPRAFVVFGPKIVAMRKSFDDPALESRFITEEMGQRSLRNDIPINLPDIQKDEALRLRNKLLQYRFETLHRVEINAALHDPARSARLNQILIPLLSVIENESLRTAIRESAAGLDTRLYAERSATLEACVLDALRTLCAQGNESISVSAIADACTARSDDEFERPITARLVGSVLRTRLRLQTYKRHGVYVLAPSEYAKLDELCVRYGVSE